MGKHGDDFIMILDIDHVFSADELSLVSRTGSDAGGEAARGAGPGETQA
jgi:hypothetical protein